MIIVLLHITVGFNNYFMIKIKNISIFPNFNKKYSYYFNIVYNVKKQFGLNYGKTLNICNNLGFNKKSQLQFNTKKKILILNLLLQKKYNINRLFILKYLYYILNTQVLIKSNKGIRHLKNLPVHGQRTHTNRDTQKKINRYSILKSLFEIKLKKKNVNTQFNNYSPIKKKNKKK